MGLPPAPTDILGSTDAGRFAVFALSLFTARTVAAPIQLRGRRLEMGHANGPRVFVVAEVDAPGPSEGGEAESEGTDHLSGGPKTPTFWLHARHVVRR